jgi:hypothetical protein
MPVLLSPNARTRNFEQTVRTVVPADFDGDASVAPDRVAFLAEIEVVDLVVRVRRRRQLGRRWERGWIQTRTVDPE